MALVRVDKVIREYRLPQKYLFQKASVFRALNNVSFSIETGESFGVVGESGCGKSTLARIIMALDKPTEGTVYYKDHDLFTIPKSELCQLRRHFQMVFQDPYGSLNPRKKVLPIVAEPLDMLEKQLSKKDRADRVKLMLSEVGLNSNDIEKYPHEFSGGQRQRIAIARALITKPSLIVADESVSALDVSVQAQVLNLIMDLQEKYNLAFLFISHDLSVVEFVTQKIAVIYLGRIVEQGETKDIFQQPLHPYTKLLLNAIPDVDPFNKKVKKKREKTRYQIDETSCQFIDRCPEATEICRQSEPQLKDHNGHLVACFNV
ncbi:ATP-binding cassette domain-containing protein [bacterium]|nr:ATP-binding cassette domain-containing protein [bacterium]